MLLRSLRVTSLLAPRAARCLRIAPPRPDAAAKAWRRPLDLTPAVATRALDVLQIAAPASAVLATNVDVAQCMDGASVGAAALAAGLGIAAAAAWSGSSDDEAEAPAPATVRPWRRSNWALPRGSRGRLIEDYDWRSRPSQVVCRGCGVFDDKHILGTCLLLGSYADEAELRAHALVFTNTANSTNMLGLRVQ